MKPSGPQELRITPPLPTRRAFAKRIARGAVIALAVVGVGLTLGAAGYHSFEGLSWLDALLNASMLLAGEGPVAPLHTVSGKIFATWYAIFSGVVFITAVSALVAPLAHRFLHRFHLELADDEERGNQ